MVRLNNTITDEPLKQTDICPLVIKASSIKDSGAPLMHQRAALSDCANPSTDSLTEVDPRRSVELNADDFFKLGKYRI